MAREAGTRNRWRLAFDIAAVGAGVAAIASAVIAVDAARSARGQLDEAREANELATRALTVAETANALAAEANIFSRQANALGKDALREARNANTIASEALMSGQASAAHDALSAAIDDAESKLGQAPELRTAIEEAFLRRNDGRVLLGRQMWKEARQTFINALIRLGADCETAGVGCEVAFDLREFFQP